MATSGSVNFTLNRDEAIAEALSIVGVGVEGEPIEAEDIAVASRKLNIMIKAWMAFGIKLWQRDEHTITLVASQNSYTLGQDSADVTMPRPLRIIECSRVDTDGNETTITGLTKEEWDSLPNKTTTGTPVNYHYDPTLTNGTLYFWQMPDATVASTYTIKIISNAPLEDMDESTNDFDFPQEWLEAISYNLAYRLAPWANLPATERALLKQDAREALDLARDYDSEDGSLFIQAEVR